MSYYARLYINDEVYYYYSMDENDFKIDDNFNVKHNAFFEEPIIFDDLNNFDDVVIDYMEPETLNCMLDNFNESLNDNAIKLLKDYKDLMKI